MGYEVKIEPRVQRYLRKLNDKKLVAKFVATIFDSASVNPEVGDLKRGNLAEVRTLKFKDAGTEYRIAYTVEEQTVDIFLAGTRENFYKELSRHIK